MFPIILDLANLKVMLVGGGDSALNRLKALDAAGAKHVSVFADNFGKDFWDVAGKRLTTRMPNDSDITNCYAIMIVDIDEERAAKIATRARELGVLVNIEDRKEYCDFFYPSIIRHGDLIVTVSTSGKSPTLAKRIKDAIGTIFTNKWAARVDDIADKRQQWRDIGLNMKEVADMSNKYIDEKGWLSEDEVVLLREEA
jgi:precorrin-2 dehydrogenase/sirohydrochlorin ferrochelatase